jgi:AbrB family looped-hinge helix DNA binding protein
MALATLTSKGQITIPKQVRQNLGISTGDRVEFIETSPGHYEVLAVTRDIKTLKGIVGEADKVISIEEMNTAIAKMGR